jgi:hypothetical protein
MHNFYFRDMHECRDASRGGRGCTEGRAASHPSAVRASSHLTRLPRLFSKRVPPVLVVPNFACAMPVWSAITAVRSMWRGSAPRKAPRNCLGCGLPTRLGDRGGRAVRPVGWPGSRQPVRSTSLAPAHLGRAYFRRWVPITAWSGPAFAPRGCLQCCSKHSRSPAISIWVEMVDASAAALMDPDAQTPELNRILARPRPSVRRWSPRRDRPGCATVIDSSLGFKFHILCHG